MANALYYEQCVAVSISLVAEDKARDILVSKYAHLITQLHAFSAAPTGCSQPEPVEQRAGSANVLALGYQCIICDLSQGMRLRPIETMNGICPVLFLITQFSYIRENLRATHMCEYPYLTPVFSRLPSPSTPSIYPTLSRLQT